jgi:hypothetical protein
MVASQPQPARHQRSTRSHTHHHAARKRVEGDQRTSITTSSHQRATAGQTSAPSRVSMSVSWRAQQPPARHAQGWCGSPLHYPRCAALGTEVCA